MSERLPVSARSAKRPRPEVPARERRFVGRQLADVHGRRGDVPMQKPRPGISKLVQWLTPSFYIDLGRPCNSACLYCAVPPHEDAQGFAPLSEVPAIIEAGLQVGCDRAILIGGEPTIYPHFEAVLQALAEQGLERRHIVMTNGLRLSEPAFVESMVGLGVGTAHLSIDTADASIYDRLSRSQGRHERQLQGLDNALAHPDLNVYVYTAVNAINADGLPDLMRMLVSHAERLGLERPPAQILAVVKPIGDGLRHADELVLSPRRSAEVISPMIALAEELGVEVGFRNVQACLVPELVAWNVDYYLDDFSVDVATGERVTYSHTEYWRKPPQCGQCGHNELCTGIYHEIETRYGVGDFVPIDRQGLKDALT